MSEKDENLKNLLEELKLEKYYAKFLEEETLYIDLKELTEDELERLIPKRIHRKRLINFLKPPKKESGDNNDKGSTPEKGEEKKEGRRRVQMKVKFGNEVKNVYDVALGTNEELIGKLLQTFLECELKLPDKTVLTKDRTFTLEEWLENATMGPGGEIRGVLSVKELGVKETESREMEEKVKQLEVKLEEVERERDGLLEKVVKMKKITKRKITEEKLEKNEGKEKRVVQKTVRGNVSSERDEDGYVNQAPLASIKVDLPPQKSVSEIARLIRERNSRHNQLVMEQKAAAKKKLKEQQQSITLKFSTIGRPGQTIEMDFHESDSIAHVKQEFAEKHHYVSGTVKLVYSGRVLKDSRKLGGIFPPLKENSYIVVLGKRLWASL